MLKLVHVVGAGLAGLAAAVQLQRRGARVTLHEAAAQAGGRCRSYYDRTLGATIDSGNHLVLSGHHATLAYLRAIGSFDELIGPTQPDLPFVDLKTMARWTVKLSPGLLPTWIVDSNARVPGTKLADYLSLASLLFAKPGRTVAQTIRCEGALWDRWLRPLLRTAMNVEPAAASALLAGAWLRETLLQGGAACRPLAARNGLGSAFVDPALRLLQHGGAAIQLGSRLQSITFDDAAHRVTALGFGDVPSQTTTLPLTAGEAVLLAVPPDIAQTLVPRLQAPQRHSAIISAHFAVEPPPGLPPITALLNGTSEWLYAYDGRLSVTINDAASRLDMPRETLARTIWAEVAQVAALAAEPMPAWQIVAEPRATFAALPDEETRRPAVRTRWTNLTLAGDWTATGLPATIEGAIRSGQRAADTLLNETMESR